VWKFIGRKWGEFSRFIRFEVGVGSNDHILVGCVVCGSILEGGFPEVV
jgi:hypothetical protein